MRTTEIIELAPAHLRNPELPALFGIQLYGKYSVKTHIGHKGYIMLFCHRMRKSNVIVILYIFHIYCVRPVRLFCRERNEFSATASDLSVLYACLNISTLFTHEKSCLFHIISLTSHFWHFTANDFRDIYTKNSGKL